MSTMTESKRYRFFRNETSPTIAVIHEAEQQKHNQNQNQQEQEQEVIIQRDEMTIGECNFLEGSDILTSIIEELQRNTRQNQPQEEIELDGNQNQDSKVDVNGSIGVDSGIVRHRQWDVISMLDCDGRVDMLLQVILQCDVKKLEIAKFLRHSRDDVCYWTGLANGLPSNTSLVQLVLRRLTITKDDVHILEQALKKNNNDNNPHHRRKNIRDLSIFYCKFSDNSHIDLARTLIQYMSPSLQTLTFSPFASMSSTAISEFLSLLLLPPPFSEEQTVATGTIAQSIGSENSVTTTPAFQRVRSVDIRMPIGDPSKIFSVLSQWLRQTQHYQQHRSSQEDTDNVDHFPLQHDNCRDDDNDNNNGYGENDDDALSLFLSFDDVESLSGTGFDDDDDDDGSKGEEEIMKQSTTAMNYFTDEFLSALAVSKLKDLEFFYCNFSSLPVMGFTKFINALKENLTHQHQHRHHQCWQRLNLEGSNLSFHSSTMATFFDSMTELSSSSLSFPGNDHRPSSLLELNLRSCHLSDDALKSISYQLRHYLSNLKKLNLAGRQKFTIQGIKNYFLPAIKRTFQLENVAMIVNDDDDGTRQMIQFYCDVNRGGRRFFKCMKQMNENNDMEQKETKKRKTTKATTMTMMIKTYPSVALWPLIFNRINDSMRLHINLNARHSMRGMFFHDDQDRRKSSIDIQKRRRASVLYFLLLNGAMIDCLGSMLVPPEAVQQQQQQQTEQQRKASKRVS